MFRRILILLACAVVLASCGTAGKLGRADIPFTYEVENMGVGIDGTYVVRISCYSRNKVVSSNIIKKNAVHAVIFKGVPAGNGSPAQPAICKSSAMDENPAFFDSFFESEYLRFINSVSRNSLTCYKISNREYKTSCVVSVSKNALRKYLEQNGVARSLSEGF